MSRFRATTILVVILSVSLAACGGGGGGSNGKENQVDVPATPTPTPTPTPSITTTPTPETSPTIDPVVIDNSDDIYALPAGWGTARVGDTTCDLASLTNEQSKRYVQSMSKAFAWLTGTIDQAHYEPIGEVANYFGFAALRGEIREREGALADEGFRGALQFEILELLNDEQRAVLYAGLNAHRDDFENFLEKRIELVDAIWQLKDGVALDFDRISTLIVEIGRLEASITAATAENYATLLPLLSDDQKNYLIAIRSGDVSTADMQSSELEFAQQAAAEYDLLSDTDKELITEIGTKFVSWITGDVEKAVFLPNGKIGNYFGFAYYRYVDRANVTRSLAASYVEGVLNDEQISLMCGLATLIDDYTDDYIDGRENLIRALFTLQDGMQPDSSTEIENYATLAGTGEGRRIVLDALHFLLLQNSLSDTQLSEIKAYR